MRSIKKLASAVIAIALAIGLYPSSALAIEPSTSLTIAASDAITVQTSTTLSGSLFRQPAKKYNDSLALISAEMCQAAGGDSDANIRAYFKKQKLADYTTANYGSSSAYGIGHKSIKVDGKSYNLLVIVARGSTTKAEFIGDFNKGGENDFLGQKVNHNVYEFEETVWPGIEKYVTETHPELSKSSNLKILVTGHSLGGACADMIAARLNKSIGNTSEWSGALVSKSNVYCYTFGAIDVLAYKPGKNITSGFENIHNGFNYYDSFGESGNLSSLKASSKYAKWGHSEVFHNKFKEDGLSCNNHLIENYIESLKKGCVVCELDDIPLSKCSVSLEKTSFAYTGKAIKPKAIVIYNEVTRKQGAAYKITYKDSSGETVTPKKVGKYKAVISGIGRFEGSVTKAFTIKAANYKVAFVANGGKGTMKPQTITRNKSTALSANKFTRAGYKFAGWNTKANGKGKSYKNKAKVKNLAAAGKTVKLYAQWKKSTEAVSFSTFVKGSAYTSKAGRVYRNDSYKVGNQYKNKLSVTYKGKTKVLSSSAYSGYITNGRYVFYCTEKPAANNISAFASFDRILYRYDTNTGANKRIAAGTNLAPFTSNGKYLYYGRHASQATGRSTLYALNLSTWKKRSMDSKATASHSLGVTARFSSSSGVLATANTMNEPIPAIYSYKVDGTGIKLLAADVYACKLSGSKVTYIVEDYSDIRNRQFKLFQCSITGKSKKALSGWKSDLQSLMTKGGLTYYY